MRNSDVGCRHVLVGQDAGSGRGSVVYCQKIGAFCSEDVGMADSRALEVCIAVYQACHFIGMPECTVHLTHAVTYLSLAAKSNALYMAYEAAKQDAKKQLAEPVPLHLRNGPNQAYGRTGLRQGLSVCP